MNSELQFLPCLSTFGIDGQHDGFGVAISAATSLFLESPITTANATTKSAI